MDLEIINKLYLELSLIATAITEREQKLRDNLVQCLEKLKELDDERSALRGKTFPRKISGMGFPELYTHIWLDEVEPKTFLVSSQDTRTGIKKSIYAADNQEVAGACFYGIGEFLRQKTDALKASQFNIDSNH